MTYIIVMLESKVRDLPIYRQHMNGCGLAAFLMLLDIPHNPPIKSFLDKVWDHIHEQFEDPLFDQKEMKWAISLQYLLLKALGYAEKNDLYTFFSGRLEFLYEDQRIMNKFNQEQYYNSLLTHKKISEAYTILHYTENHDYVTPLILFKNLHTMKTDLELKVLGEIFNYEFLYQDSEDYTGAIYFTNKELGREIAQTARVKWNRLEKLVQQPGIVVLYGQAHHWLAVRGFYKITNHRAIPDEVLEEIKSKPKKKTQQDQKSPTFPNQKTQTQSELDEKSNVNSNSDKSSSNPAKLPIAHTKLPSDPSEYSTFLAEISAIFDDETAEWHPKRMIIDINDSALFSRVKMPYRNLNESDRFYFFRKRKIKEYPVFDLFLKYMEDDVVAEKVRWKDYLKKRDEDFSQKFKTRVKNMSKSKLPDSDDSLTEKSEKIEEKTEEKSK
ncbi:MAG: hypothetical protein ACTSYI_09830 [Promethearchaeota archaeon]